MGSNAKLVNDILSQYYAAKEFYRDYHDEVKENRQFVRGVQWNTDQTNFLEKRSRPVLVFDKIQPHIESITGTYRVNRLEMVAKPWNIEDEGRAIVMNLLLKYINQTSNLEFLEPRILEDALIDGTAWREIRLVPGKDYRFDVKIGRGDTLNYFPDPNAVEEDSTEDMEYLIKTAWLAKDRLKIKYHKKEREIESNILVGKEFFENEDETSTPNDRLINATREDIVDSTGCVVRVFERWSKKYEEVLKVYNNETHQLFHFKESADKRRVQRLIREIADTPNLTLIPQRKPKIWVTTIAQNVVLEDGMYPVQTGNFPFVRQYCYKKERETWSLVTKMKDPQREINKRRSSWLLGIIKNMGLGYMYVENSIDEEIWRRDPDLKPVRGSLDNVKPMQAPSFNSNIAQYDMIMRQDIQEMGQPNASRGMEESAGESGRLFNSKVRQGNMRLMGIMDAMRFASKLTAEEALRTAQQVMNDARMIRVIGEDGRAAFSEINTTFENRIDIGGYDVVMDEAQTSANAKEYYTSVLFQAFQTMAQANPAMTQFLPWDIVMESIDHPKKREIVAQVKRALQAVGLPVSGGGGMQGGLNQQTPNIMGPQEFAQADGGANRF